MMDLDAIIRAAWEAGWKARGQYANRPLGDRLAAKPKLRDAYIDSVQDINVSAVECVTIRTCPICGAFIAREGATECKRCGCKWRVESTLATQEQTKE